MPDYSDMIERPKLIRLCSDCQKEQGIDYQALQKLGWIVTHGICYRHLLRSLKLAGLSAKNAEEAISRRQPLNTRDLNLPENRHLLNWLKNPTAAPKT